MATDQLFQQMERVRPKLQPWLNSLPVASNFIEKGEVETIGERDYRIPVKLQEMGRYGTMDTDGGPHGRGNNMKGDKLISSFFTTRMNGEVTQKQIDATKNNEVALVKVFNDGMKNMMPHFGLQEDFSFHGDGTPLMATATAVATVSGKTVYTLESAVGVRFLRRGQQPVVYSSGYAAVLSNTLYIYSVDFNNKKVTMSGVVPGAGATDILCYEGVSGTGSAPAWKKGLFYFINSSTSSTILGLSQASEPEVQSNTINVNGVISWQAGMALLDMMDQRRPATSPKLIGLISRAQRAQIMIQEMAFSKIERTKSGQAPIDMLPKISMQSFDFCGVDSFIDPQMDATKWVVWDPKSWGRAQMTKLDWVTNLDGTKFFRLMAGDNGPSSSQWFGMKKDEDWYNFDIATGGMLYGCTQPSNY